MSGPGLIYYDKRNRVVYQGKNVTYTKEFVFGNWVGESVVASAAKVYYGHMWKFTRRCTKHYAYVGMERTTALSCYDYLVGFYRRTGTFMTWSSTAGNMGDWESFTYDGQIMAKIRRIRRSQNLYDVDIVVDEYDEKWNKDGSAVSWALEDSRDYDDIGGES